MTITTVTSSQSIGTSTNIGNDKFLTKTTLQTTTSAYFVTPRVTNGTTGAAGNKSKVLRVWYTTSSFSLTASVTAAIRALEQTARYIDVPLKDAASGVAIQDSSTEVATGSYVYIWAEIPTLDVAASLDINLVEIP